ncbi:PAS domain-containing protein [Mesorhizobium sp. M1428]|uniref:PAS domain-containing protein n=1 Tax=Mesorhizobium sp. M1428 TaxID=2957102 RepID=UPI003337733D
MSAAILPSPEYVTENGAFALSLVVRIFGTISFYGRLYQGAGSGIADIPGIAWSACPDGCLRFLIPAAFGYIGVTVEEMRAIMDADELFLVAEICPSRRCRGEHGAMAPQPRPMIEERRLRRLDGTYQRFRDTGVASRDDQGRIVGWHGHTENIDDRRKAETATQEREELRLLIDTVPTMIWLMTPAGLRYYFNKRFADWADISSATEEPRGTQQFASYVELFHPDDQAGVKAVLQKSFAWGEPLQHRGQLCRKDCEYRWVDSRFEPLRDEGATIPRWYGVNFDIDDEVRAQESLRLGTSGSRRPARRERRSSPGPRHDWASHEGGRWGCPRYRAGEVADEVGFA